MSRRFFILLPGLSPTGPVKGAFALANALVAERDVTLVSLKTGAGTAAAPLDDRVRLLNLDGAGGLRAKTAAYRRLLREAGGRAGVASISLCLSADAVNQACRADAVTASSIRGNLFRNYSMDYGTVGYAIAAGHLALMRRFDHVVAMSSTMARQVRPFAGQHPAIIGNFVDEAALDVMRPAISRRDGPLRFAFVGSLSKRKQPKLIIETIAALRRSGGQHAEMDIIGTGPLEAELRAAAVAQGVADSVHFHGFLANPYPVLGQADAFVLPSLSEGISRAALEALHLGIPCVLRAVDGNDELVQAGVNGMVFRHEGELGEAMVRAAAIRRAAPTNISLLPPGFRQQSAAMQYRDLVERQP